MNRKKDLVIPVSSPWNINIMERLYPLYLYKEIHERYQYLNGFKTNILSLVDVCVWKVASIIEKNSKSSKGISKYK